MSISGRRPRGRDRSGSIVIAAPSTRRGCGVSKHAAPLAQVEFATLPDDTVLSYNLKNLTVVDGQNSTIAEIKNLALSNGRLDGFLGMGERYVAIDPASVALTYDVDAKKWKASINASNDQFKAAPEFKYEGKYKN